MTNLGFFLGIQSEYDLKCNIAMGRTSPVDKVELLLVSLKLCVRACVSEDTLWSPLTLTCVWVPGIVRRVQEALLPPNSRLYSVLSVQTE